MSYYLPLHVHTDFSNGDALLDVDEYVKWAKENNYPSISVTDHGNLCASLYFNQVASKAGIKSVIGLEAYCAYKKEFESQDKEEKRERDHCLLVAKNYQGYLDLCWLLGQAMRNSFYYKPIILYEELFKHNKNLIVSSACMGGRIPKLILENKQDEAIEFINQMKSAFGDDFYIEIMEIQISEQTAFNNWVINNYKRLGVKVIWTTDTHYLKPEHAEVHDIMKLINSKMTLRYCQDCAKVIGEALATVPVKFKKEFVPTNDYTREEIISAQEKRCEKLPIHRIMMPLFDLEEPTNQQHNFCEMMKDPISKQRVYYSVTWWSKEPDKVEICKEVWWDMINDCVAKDQYTPSEN